MSIKRRIAVKYSIEDMRTDRVALYREDDEEGVPNLPYLFISPGGLVKIAYIWGHARTYYGCPVRSHYSYDENFKNLCILLNPLFDCFELYRTLTSHIGEYHIRNLLRYGLGDSLDDDQTVAYDLTKQIFIDLIYSTTILKEECAPKEHENER